MADERERDARAAALRVLDRCNIKCLDQIDLDVIAESLGAEIVNGDLDGAMGSLIRIGPHAKIRISDRVTDIGGQRFTGGHEIGHIVCDPPRRDGDQLTELLCNPFERSRKAPERVASVFASELLMPEPWLKPYCTVPCITLGLARAIADECTTSLLASAMRVIELSPESCAVAYSVYGRVKWVKRSASFPDWIPRGRRLDPLSAAAEYARTGKLDHGVHVVGADAWLPRTRLDSASVQLVEQSAVIPELGAVFTMLWLPRREIRHLDLSTSHRPV
jgi:hypothetical protein